MMLSMLQQGALAFFNKAYLLIQIHPVILVCSVWHNTLWHKNQVLVFDAGEQS